MLANNRSLSAVHDPQLT